MKNKYLLLLLLSLSVSVARTQNGPLTGSGKIISKSYSYVNFDKIGLYDLSGKVEVQAGKPFSISIDIDDNLEPLLDVAMQNNTLLIKLKGNRNNKLYIENTHIRINISLPQISCIQHRGNTGIVVNGILGKQFQLQQSGNGNIKLAGTIEALNITKSGNGNVIAENVKAKLVTVQSAGNGNVTVNAATTFKANGSGNGYIKNIGSALADASSSKSGNGDIIDSAFVTKLSSYAGYKENTRIKTRLQNNTSTTVALKVLYPVKGNYGIDIKPGALRSEYFPLGTKIYRVGNMGQPLFEITPQNRNTLLVIE